MSGQWEVVARTKKEKPVSNGKIKPVEEEKKKFLENSPKPGKKGPIDVAPNFYMNLDKDDDSKNKETQVKKVAQKKVAQNKKPVEKKPTDVVKVKKPHTLEQALASIDSDEVWAVYKSYTNAGNVSCLLDMARFINTKLTVDQNDEVYTDLPLDYPLSIVPSNLKDVIEKAIKEHHRNNINLFLELCLSSIANNMIKGMPATGYKVMSQLIANMDENYSIHCIPKVANLMKSYQNRPNIALSLLWAIGQGGFKNINAGIKIWQEALVPMMEMRNYVKFIITYLIKLLKHHLTNSEGKKTIIRKAEFLNIFDFIHSKKKGVPKDLEVILNNQSPVLRKLYFEKTESWKDFDFVDQLLERFPNSYAEKKQQYDPKTKELLNCFMEALRKKESSYKVWADIHGKYLKQTSHVLIFIENNWKSLNATLNKRHLKTTVSHFKRVYQEQMSSKNKDPGAQEALRTSQNILNKMAGSRIFPWIFGCVVLLPLICGLLVVYDVQRAGTFEKSNTGRFLKDVGALEGCQVAWSRSLAASARGYKWAEKNTPHYFSAVADFSKPYVELTRDLILVLKNQATLFYSNIRELATEKGPVVYSTIDYYVPGFLTTVQGYSSTAWNAVKEFSCYYFNLTLTYLKTKVFIDNWAPEILHAKTLQALNTTQIYAAEYYNWFHKQVDDYSKIQ